MTDTPQPLTARLTALRDHIAGLDSGSGDAALLTESLATISSLEAKIAELRQIPPGTAYIGGEPVLTASHAGQVRDKTEDWERKRSSQAGHVPHVASGSSTGDGIGGEPVSSPPVSPPDTMERLQNWARPIDDTTTIGRMYHDLRNTHHRMLSKLLDAAGIKDEPHTVSLGKAEILAERIAAGYRKPVSPAPLGDAMEMARQFLVDAGWVETATGDIFQKDVDDIAALLTSDRAATEARVREEIYAAAAGAFTNISGAAAMRNVMLAAIRAGDKT